MRKIYENSIVYAGPKGIVVKRDLNHGERVRFHAFTPIGEYVFGTYDEAINQLRSASRLVGK